ncbi:MAG: Hsp20/alpha crystallin family protein [Gemmataceae bacterium]|nr:Hsp20/alpha crystallin family protein [Gemmataceae bacterium]
MLPAIRNTDTALAPVNRLAGLLDRFFRDDPFFAPLAAPAWSAIPAGMWEDEHAVTVEVDAPGVKAEGVEVSVHDGTLIVRGERKCERSEGGCDARSYGRFEQRLTLPAAVDADRVEAKLSGGVLTIILPKSEEAKPRKIAVRAE